MPKPTRHRSAKSGKFVTAKTAKRRPATTVVETRKKKGKVWWGFESIKRDEYGGPIKALDLYKTKEDAVRRAPGFDVTRYRVEEIG